jgi:hypothetical protein
MKTAIACLSLLAAFAIAPAGAIEKLPIKDIPSAALTTDTQIQFDSGDTHIGLVWWIPYEFWQSVFARDEQTPAHLKKDILDTLNGYSILGVVQADISAEGAFSFYSKADISKTLKVAHRNAAGASKGLKALPKIDQELQLMLASITPILTAAMGNLGQNFHFYIYTDKIPDGGRLLDPYKVGALKFDLATKAGKKLSGQLDLPLNALFKPRLCPNGKPAHVSWKFCPWTSKELPK